MTDDRTIGGRANRLVAGVNALAGATDNRQFANTGGVKGALLSSSRDESRNLSAYVEETFYVLPTVALIGGLQFLHTTRDREDRFLSDGDQSGRTAFDLWSPKGGILWDAAPGWQVFANISRSAEAPSFGENSAAVPFTAVKPQTATSYELGTRGERPGYAWDVALYRADIENELQCLFSAFGNCTVTNADRTIHQGIEAGGRLRLAEGLIATGEIPDRVWLKASYTLNDFRFDDDPKFGDNALPGAPRHYLRAELLYRHPRGFYAGPNVEWVPQGYFVDSANSVKTDPYALLGLRAGYDGERFSAYLEGRNLADTAYIASASIIDVATPATALFEPGTGRAVYAGIRLRW